MRTFLSTLLLASAVAPSAFAQDTQTPPTPPPPEQSYGSGQYISLTGGFVGATSYDYGDVASDVEAELESGFGVAGAWGAYFSENWRGEFALSYRSQAIESIDGFDADLFGADSVSVISLDINTYYDFPTGGPFRPYVGGGLGVGGMNVDDGLLDGSGTAVTLQAMAGGSIEVSDKVTLFVEGRYQYASVGVDTDGDEEDAEEDLSVGGFGVYAGIRFGI
jgi:opacity protein-like surface antigen